MNSTYEERQKVKIKNFWGLKVEEIF